MDILSTGVRVHPWSMVYGKDNAYYEMSGTSMAAPHVTAALAMMRSEFPKATSQELIRRLLESTDPILTLEESNKVILNKYTIARRLNLARALRKDLVGSFGCLSEDELNDGEVDLAQNVLANRHRVEDAAGKAQFYQEKALVASSEPHQALLWDKAIEEVSQVVEAWNNLQQQYESGIALASEGSKSWWQSELNVAIAGGDQWHTTMAQWETQKNQSQCSVM